jgi:hypothetical protein
MMIDRAGHRQRHGTAVVASTGMRATTHDAVPRDTAGKDARTSRCATKRHPTELVEGPNCGLPQQAAAAGQPDLETRDRVGAASTQRDGSVLPDVPGPASEDGKVHV